MLDEKNKQLIISSCYNELILSFLFTMPELKLTDLPTDCQSIPVSTHVADPVLKLIYEDTQETMRSLKLSSQSLSSVASNILLSSLILSGLEMVNTHQINDGTNTVVYIHALVLLGVLLSSLFAIQSLKTKAVVCYQ